VEEWGWEDDEGEDDEGEEECKGPERRQRPRRASFITAAEGRAEVWPCCCCGCCCW